MPKNPMLLPITILCIGALAAGIGYFQKGTVHKIAQAFGAQNQAEDTIQIIPDVTASPTIEPSPTLAPTPIATISAKPTPTSKTTKAVSTNKKDPDLIQALSNKYGSQVSVSIDKITGEYAQGTLRAKDKVDRWWLAAHNSSWIIVADGSSYVSCSTIATYSFPTNMVPICSKGSTLVNR